LKNKKIVLKPLFHKKVDPLTKLLQEIFAENRFAMSYLGALAIGLGFSQPTKLIAQEDEGVEEVVVTATKRESNAQDLPLSVQAITSEQLEAKNVKDFRDIANLSPSLIVDDSGSGNSYFYARGVSDGGFGNRAGAQASTALYIDDQPLYTIGGNPDLHIYDI
jgi:outer membrane receptor protein involved in Fe transport